MGKMWSACLEHVTNTCFVRYFKMKKTTETVSNVQEEKEETLDIMDEDATVHGVSFTKVGLQNPLDSFGENIIEENLLVVMRARKVAVVPETLKKVVELEDPEGVEREHRSP